MTDHTSTPLASAHGGGAGSLARLQQLLLLLFLLYAFLCSIDLLGSSFKLFGTPFVDALFKLTDNPFVGLFVGVLATSLVQSSSTVTSLVVVLVASGSVSIDGAIPMIMGANIGTSVTSTLVALGHVTRSDEFRRAFAAATVHDFFNIMAVTVLFPLELATGFLRRVAIFLEQLLLGSSGAEFKSPLKMIVKPTVEFVLDQLALIFTSKAGLAIAACMLGFILMMISLQRLVVLLKRAMMGRAENVMQRAVFEKPFVAFILGIVITVLVQSSSVTTSVSVPLVAAGFVTLNQIFPFVLGANIGTTITAMLASLVTGSSAAVVVALVHLSFNVSGIIILYPLRSIPISAARWLGDLTQRSKLYALAYVVVVFFVIPLTLIFLSR